MIISQAGQFGGWSLYLKDGKPVYGYNYLGLETYTVASDAALPQGKATIKLDFAYGGERKLGAGGTAIFYINGEKVGEGKIEKTQCCIFSADETGAPTWSSS